MENLPSRARVPAPAIALLLALAIPAMASAGDAGVFGESIYAGMVARFDPAHTPGWQTPDPELRALLEQRRANHRRNRFCLLGYRWPDGYAFVSVHWLEGELILRWSGGTHWSAMAPRSLIAHKVVDLRTGVIDADHPHGSTFLVTRRQAEGTIADCRRHGRYYTVAPFPASPPADDADRAPPAAAAGGAVRAPAARW